MSEAISIDAMLRARCGASTPCIALLVAACLVSAGCGSSRDPNLPTTASASGKVTYKGQPVNTGTITLHPLGKGNPAVGLLDANGNFELSTYGARDGAVIGQHKVTIEIPPAPDGMPGSATLSIPRAYTNRETTPLTVEVAEGGPNVLEIVLEE